MSINWRKYTSPTVVVMFCNELFDYQHAVDV